MKSINQSKFITLGNVQQYLIIRSQNIENPVLLILHGGTSETAQFVKFNHPLEQDFTVVYWDQRGEGKSYVKESDSSLLTLERYVEDIHELTLILKKQFNQEKIYLLGHSMGTLLGMKTVKKYPENYKAYIAVSQASDPIKNDNIVYDKFLKILKGRELKKLHKKVRISKNNLLSIDIVKRTEEAVMALMVKGGMYHKSGFWTMLKIFLLPILTLKEYNFRDKRRTMIQNKERLVFYYQTCLSNSITKLDVPIYFIHGADDLITNYALSREYFKNIEAPYKEFISFEKSAHFPPFEEPDRFNVLITKILRES